MKLMQKLELIRDALQVIAAANKNNVEPHTIAFIICNGENKSEVGIRVENAADLSRLERALIRSYAQINDITFDEAIKELINSEEERTNENNEHNG